MSHMKSVLRIALAGLAAGAGVIATLPAASEAAFPGTNGRIAFATNHAADVFNFDIYSMSPSGANLVQLTDDPELDSGPEYSPDGERVAFIRSREGGGTDIWVMRSDGTDEQLVGGSAAGVSLPVWSPNGNWIAFAYQNGGTSSNWDIFKVKLDGTEIVALEFLTDDPADDFAPAWSPGGNRIAFVSERDGNGEIYTMRADGTAEKNLSNSPDSYDSNPDWSPNAARLVFESDRIDDQFDVFRMRSDGTNVQRLTASPANDINAAWSPNGQRIAFQSFRDGDAEIFTMWSDGSHEAQRTHNTLIDLNPDWQPR